MILERMPLINLLQYFIYFYPNYHIQIFFPIFLLNFCKVPNVYGFETLLEFERLLNKNKNTFCEKVIIS